jgi:outer membrane receptor protein involved in Fe transport
MQALRWSASGYLLDMTDEIAANPVTFANENLDKTRHLGAETEIALSAPKWLGLSAAYALALATFRDGPYEGNRIPAVPLHTASAEISFVLPLGLRSGISGSYIAETYAFSDRDNTQAVVPGYFLIDAFVRFQPDYLPGNLALYFGVENLLDVSYASFGVYSSFSAAVFYYPGEGRNWKIGASYRY